MIIIQEIKIKINFIKHNKSETIIARFVSYQKMTKCQRDISQINHKQELELESQISVNPIYLDLLQEEGQMYPLFHL